MTLFSFDNITDLDSVERDFGFTPLSFTKYLKEQGVSHPTQEQGQGDFVALICLSFPLQKTALVSYT